VISGASRSAWACFSDNQFPVRTPIDFALFTRVIPAASSGASSPLSAASTASFRTAVIRTLMETEPSARASRDTRQALTVAFVKPGRGSWPYQAMNSSSPRLQTRRVIGEGDAIQNRNPQPLPVCRPVCQYRFVHLGPLRWAISETNCKEPKARTPVDNSIISATGFQRFSEITTHNSGIRLASDA
jgi:hypothetical protein